MKTARMFLVAWLWIVPAMALAHEPGEHPADPNLHVDPSVDDCSVRFAPELTQDAFGRFVREFGSVSAFKLTSPPTTLGKWHVALGVEQLSFSVEEKAAAWNDTFTHPDAYHELGARHDFPKVTLRLGLADRVDVGGYYTRNPEANYGWMGLDAKYAALRQDEVTPVSVALRAAYTRTLYVDDMDMNTFTADVAAGRTWRGFLTPYAALGGDVVLASETSPVVDLQRETQVVPHALAGIELRYWRAALGAEAQWGALASYQVQVKALF